MENRKPNRKWKTNGSARYAAIIFARPNHPDAQKRFAKYPYVSNEAWSRLRMRRDFPEAIYYHLYDRKVLVNGKGKYLYSYNLITNEKFYINGNSSQPNQPVPVQERPADSIYDYARRKNQDGLPPAF